MLDNYGFGYLALVLRIKADCSRAKIRYHLGYELFLHSPLCEPEHLAPLLQSFKVRSATPANGEPLQTRFSVMTPDASRAVEGNTFHS
jgi:hypothetical protein